MFFPRSLNSYIYFWKLKKNFSKWTFNIKKNYPLHSNIMLKENFIRWSLPSNNICKNSLRKKYLYNIYFSSSPRLYSSNTQFNLEKKSFNCCLNEETFFALQYIFGSVESLIPQQWLLLEKFILIDSNCKKVNSSLSINHKPKTVLNLCSKYNNYKLADCYYDYITQTLKSHLEIPELNMYLFMCNNSGYHTKEQILHLYLTLASHFPPNFFNSKYKSAWMLGQCLTGRADVAYFHLLNNSQIPYFILVEFIINCFKYRSYKIGWKCFTKLNFKKVSTINFLGKEIFNEVLKYCKNTENAEMSLYYLRDLLKKFEKMNLCLDYQMCSEMQQMFQKFGYSCRFTTLDVIQDNKCRNCSEMLQTSHSKIYFRLQNFIKPIFGKYQNLESNKFLKINVNFC